MPDWILAERGLYLVGAKVAQTGAANAYHPDQLRTGQKWFLKLLGRYAPGYGLVVVLGATGFVELTWPESHETLSAAEFRKRMKPYA